MLVELYQKLNTHTEKIRQSIQEKHPSRLGIFLATKIFSLEIALSFTKYLFILFKHPSESFKILVNQPALAVCPYSYTDHKSFQKKVRVFSLGGLTALIGATIISSLILNLTTGPIFQSKAATYTFTQTNWSGGATVNNASHSNINDRTNWNEYSAKDANLTTINSGADLQLSTTSSQTTQTSDTDYNTGTLSNTAVSGTGDSADLVLSTVAHINEYTIGALANINVDATAVTDNSNGTWTITLGTADLSRIFKNDKFKDEASPQKSWKILSSFDSANKLIVIDSEGNGGSPSAAGASQATVGRWYASISLWEAGREGNLVTRGAIERGLPYYDGSADTTAVVIDGWTTDATHYIEIYVPLSERHRGVWDNNRYRLVVNSQYSPVFIIQEEYMRVEGLQIENTASKAGGNTSGGIRLNITNTTSSDIRISSNIMRNTGTGTGGSAYGVHADVGVNFYVWNNIIYDFNTGMRIVHYSDLSISHIVYNNTLINNTATGITADINPTPVLRLYNNIANGNTTDYSIIDSDIDASGNNISQDATSPNTTLRNKTVPFVDSTNKDFHLEFRDGTGNPAMNAGADLSADANLAFTTDIDNDTRSGTWDIGADDVGATLVKVHSIGTASRNFSTLQNWESARDGVLTTRNVFKIATQSAAFTEGETITGTSGATGTYIKERDTPSASETYMTVDKVNATAFVAGDTLTGGTSLSTATLSTILTTAGTIERGEAYNDGTFAAVTIDGSTTGANNYMWLTVAPSARHRGVAGTGAKISCPTYSCINLNDTSTIFEYFDIYGSSANERVIDFYGTSGSKVRNNLITGAAYGYCLGSISSTGGFLAYNNIIYNCVTGIYGRSTGENIYNNIIYNSTTGIMHYIETGSAREPLLRNNIVVGNTTDYNINGGSWGAASSNNISSDASAPGAGSLTSQTLAQVAFVSTTAGMEDFHLLPASVAKDAGTSLSSTFTTDIDSQTRPVGSVWDIGADEWSPSSPVYNSSGTYTSTTLDTTAQNIISATLTKTDSVGTGSIAYELSNNGGTTYASVTAGSAYTFATTGSNLKARATFTSTDLISTPSLDDVTVSYTYYPASQTLTSSAYNSTDSANIIGSLAWTEDASLPTGATVTTSLRAASSSAGLSSASWNDFTNATTNCTKSTSTVTCPLTAFPQA